ncbi:MAG: TMEM43 family protein [Rhodanobacteraceae bacterium]
MRQIPALLEKSPRSALVLGALLLVAGLVLLAFTERADRLRVMAEDALGAFVLTGPAATPGPAANGRLVLAAGAPDVKSPARDAQFGVAVDAPALVRKVEMFQWNQIGSRGQPGYEVDWFDHPIDSSAFVRPAGHTNPGAFPIGAQRFDSPDVVVGGFKLAPALVGMIEGVEPFKPDLSQLPPNMAATFQVRDGTLVTSTNAARPQVGDLRISWMKIAPSAVTVFARNTGGELVPVRNPAGEPVAQVMLGRLSLASVLTDAPRAPRFGWARRVLAVLLAWGGVALLLRAFRRRDAALALAIAIVPLALVGAAYWYGVWTAVFAALVIVAVLAGAVAAWRVALFRAVTDRKQTIRK